MCVVVQLLSCVRPVTLWTAAHQAPLSFTLSRSLLSSQGPLYEFPRLQVPQARDCPSSLCLRLPGPPLFESSLPLLSLLRTRVGLGLLGQFKMVPPGDLDGQDVDVPWVHHAGP